jgi:hypothetical protein
LTATPLDRFAVLSDIHGNLSALEAVLADIASRSVSQIVNLGDHLQGPLHPVGHHRRAPRSTLAANRSAAAKGRTGAHGCAPDVPDLLSHSRKTSAIP